jgi:hypothetical protein
VQASLSYKFISLILYLSIFIYKIILSKEKMINGKIYISIVIFLAILNTPVKGADVLPIARGESSEPSDFVRNATDSNAKLLYLITYDEQGSKCVRLIARHREGVQQVTGESFLAGWIAYWTTSRIETAPLTTEEKQSVMQKLGADDPAKIDYTECTHKSYRKFLERMVSSMQAAPATDEEVSKAQHTSYIMSSIPTTELHDDLGKAAMEEWREAEWHRQHPHLGSRKKSSVELLDEGFDEGFNKVKHWSKTPSANIVYTARP